jgi:hypothetical protein
MRIAYYFEPASGSRPKHALPGKILKVVKEVDYMDLEKGIEPLWTLIRENQTKFGIKPLAIISGDTEAMFNYMVKHTEEGLLARLLARSMGSKNAQQWTIEDISDKRMGWGLGW